MNGLISVSKLYKGWSLITPVVSFSIQEHAQKFYFLAFQAPCASNCVPTAPGYKEGGSDLKCEKSWPTPCHATPRKRGCPWPWAWFWIHRFLNTGHDTSCYFLSGGYSATTTSMDSRNILLDELLSCQGSHEPDCEKGSCSCLCLGGRVTPG